MLASELLPARFNVASYFVDRNVEEGCKIQRFKLRAANRPPR